MILFTFLVRSNGKHFFPPAEKKSLERGELGHRKEKWDG